MKYYKYKLPDDFEKTYLELKNDKKLSVNALVKRYNVAPSVVHRWLDETNLNIKKNNIPKEYTIDLKNFIKDCESGEYTLSNIAKKWDLSNKNVILICKRQNVITNFKSDFFDPKDKNEVFEMIMKIGKQKTAKKYGITLAEINGWCKKNDITIPKYHGVKRTDVDKHTQNIIVLHKSGHSLSFLSKLYNTSSGKIRRILENNGISIVTEFDKWDISRDFVKNNFDVYYKENINGLDLKEISLKYNISYEQLKAEFKNRGVEIVLHSYNKSKGELEVKDYIQSLDFDANSIKRKYNGVTYEIDCFVKDKNFGLEYCGEYWHSYNAGCPKKYHYNKFKWAQEQNITLMTIFEHEWNTNKDLIKSMIRSRLGLNSLKIYARDTEAMIISNNAAKIFHDYNHINGGLNTFSINIGLFYNNDLVSVTSFSKPRFSNDTDYELLRFSTTRNMTVVGGFSKMISYFNKTHNNPSILTYCDLRFGEGKVYEKTGFELQYTTPPNYWYYYKGDGSFGKFESRIKYQKHKLKNLDNYDTNKTEYDIMNENGYLKIHDCGNHRYIKR